MIEVPDPVHDDASSESAEEPVALPLDEEPVQPQEVEKKKEKRPAPSLKDRVKCEACGREVSLYCLRYSHKCKAKVAPKAVPQPKKQNTGPSRPALSKKVIQKAVYWRDLQEQDEPDSPDFELGDHLKQLHLYNRETAFRKAAGPYSALFAH